MCLDYYCHRGSSAGGRCGGKWLIWVSYSNSPHCSDYLHPAAGATHLQTADVLQDVRERLNGCSDCVGIAGLAFLFISIVISSAVFIWFWKYSNPWEIITPVEEWLIDWANSLSHKHQIFDCSEDIWWHHTVMGIFHRYLGIYMPHYLLFINY